MTPSINDCIHGFTVEAIEEIDDFDGTAYYLRHLESGAQLLFFANDDREKAFSITFKTPPDDDTGVFHILEHSVLCGSDRFPVHEPFVNLLKTSMQTYLNAETHSDHTMYPVATTNEQDLYNLMDVYMDAVFYPLAAHDDAIFQQEGWHYDVDGDTLLTNGVVLNEMRGHTAPEEELDRQIFGALFPDTTYRFNSGGFPDDIPSLTYQRFLDMYHRHYRPDNAQIILYGDLDMDRALAWFDERYLSRLVSRNTPQEPIRIPDQSPVTKLDIRVEADVSPDKARCTLSAVIGSVSTPERTFAAMTLIDALLSNNDSPLKRALLDAGFCANVYGEIDSDLRQPVLIITSVGTRPDSLGIFLKTIENTCRELVDGGIPRELIEASISRAEFRLISHEFGGTPDGLQFMRDLLEGWLYEDGCRTGYVNYRDYIAFVRDHMEGDWFERLLRELLIDNTHKVAGELLVGKGTEKSARALPVTEEARAEAAAFAEKQKLRDLPDTPEALATLPTLHIDDLGEARPEPDYHAEERDGISYLLHDVDARGIVYTLRRYDVSALPQDELPYLAFLCDILTQLGTEKYSSAELALAIKSKLGSLSFGLESSHHLETDAFSVGVLVKARALSKYTGLTSDLVHEVMLKTDFLDLDKLRLLITQQFQFMQMTISSGYYCTQMIIHRTTARIRSESRVVDAASGLEKLFFLEKLNDMLGDEEALTDLARHLHVLALQVFAGCPSLIDFVGSDEDLEVFHAAETAAEPPEAPAIASADAPLSELSPLAGGDEAVILPVDAAYNACVADLRGIPARFSGVWMIAANPLNYDYLWNEVRVKGGAYGGSFIASNLDYLTFLSHNDPNIDRTFATFGKSGTWLSGFEISSEDLEGAVISTVAGIDRPRKPHRIAELQFEDHVTGRDREYRMRLRNEVISASEEDLHGIALQLEEALLDTVAGTCGSKELIGKSTHDFSLIDPFDALGK